jgi:arylformamidase
MNELPVKAQIRALGRFFNPEIIQASQAIYAALLAKEKAAPVWVERDVAYGAHQRHRLDIHRPVGESGGPLPVLMFVHGGGFVGGEKTRPNSPFYDNVGSWAASQDLIGVNMTYRLAPAAPWPAGAEDVAAAVAWVGENASSFGGDPGGLFLMGQSAGAVHVASYIAHSRFHSPGGAGIAGGVMLSGLYDLTRAEPNPMHTAYFGDDVTKYDSLSTITGLGNSMIPLLFTVSEFDPLDFQRQAALLSVSFLEIRKALPRLLYLPDHNHLSSVLQLGTPCDSLGHELKNFIAGVCDGTIPR